MAEGVIAVPVANRHRLHDPSVTLEEYYYYAKIQREQEKRGLGPKEREDYYNGLSKPESPGHTSDGSTTTPSMDEKTDEKHVSTGIVARPSEAAVSPAEWETASRAARNATWGSM